MSYGSFILTPAQQKYCVTRRELLAIVCLQYRHFLLGCKFMIRTDHNSLAWLMRFRGIQGQLARWIEELSQFDMQILHSQGRKHSNADALSRIPDLLEPCDCYQAGTDLKISSVEVVHIAPERITNGQGLTKKWTTWSPYHLGLLQSPYRCCS